MHMHVLTHEKYNIHIYEEYNEKVTKYAPDPSETTTMKKSYLIYVKRHLQ